MCSKKTNAVNPNDVMIRDGSSLSLSVFQSKYTKPQSTKLLMHRLSTWKFTAQSTCSSIDLVINRNTLTDLSNRTGKVWEGGATYWLPAWRKMYVRDASTKKRVLHIQRNGQGDVCLYLGEEHDFIQLVLKNKHVGEQAVYLYALDFKTQQRYRLAQLQFHPRTTEPYAMYIEPNVDIALCVLAVSAQFAYWHWDQQV